MGICQGREKGVKEPIFRTSSRNYEKYDKFRMLLDSEESQIDDQSRNKKKKIVTIINPSQQQLVNKRNSEHQQEENFQDSFRQIECQKNNSIYQNQSSVFDLFEDQSNTKLIFLYGIPNKGNTCFINSTLQLIKQIYYLEERFLNIKSKFANLLTSFYQKLDRREQIDNELNEIIQVSRSSQNHIKQNGGDSYVTLLNFLDIISKEVNFKQDGQLSRFQQYFSIVSNDGLLCQRCQKYDLQNRGDFQFFQEVQSSIDVNQIEDMCFPKSVYGKNFLRQKCQTCKKQQLLMTCKTLKNSPKYLIVKFPSKTIQQNNGLVNDKLPLLVGNEYKLYEIIGYCTYTGSHYTYTAKFNNQWILFNDSYVSKVDPNLNYSLCFLTKRL